MEMLRNSAGWVMILSGVLTLTMLRAAITPRAALQSMFGETVAGPVAEIVVRNWGVLIALVGAMLVYGGWTASHTDFILVIAGASKLAFITLVLIHGRAFLTKGVGVAIAVDAVFVALFAAILLAG